MEDRKGFFTEEQEQQLDELLELKGIAEAFDGPMIKAADNKGLQKLKDKLSADKLPAIYEFVDEMMKALSEFKK